MPDYHLEGVKWSDSDITWSFANPIYNSNASTSFSASISGQYQDAILGALQQWSSVSGLTFTRVEDSPNAGSVADIRIGFGALNTSSTGTIGDAHFSWFSGGTLLPGAIVRLEDPSQLALVPGDGGAYTYAGTQTTLQQVALHEIGHALGLDHSSEPSSAMYASSGPANRAPNGSDIAGIQSLYGAPGAKAAPVPVAAASPASAAPAAAETGDASGGAGATPDVLVLYFSADAWQGDAGFVVGLDGRQLGPAQTVTASHASGQSQAFAFQGNFGVGSHDLAVSFINDAYGGTPETDRNLYLDAVEYNGVRLDQGTAAFYAAGTVHLPVGGASHGALWVTEGAGSALA